MRWLGFISLSLVTNFVVSCSGPSEPNKPNIIFILADDLGYMDLGVYASRMSGVPREQLFYETPNIDRLANRGIAFSQAYAYPLCSPTRTALLTGRYPAELGFCTATAGSAETFYAKGEIPPEGFHEQECLWGDSIPIEQALINGYTRIALPSGQAHDKGENALTLAEGLKDYHSAFLGKWHLGGHGSKGYQPGDQGFQELGYFDSGGSPYFDWRERWDQREKIFPRMRQKKLWQGKSGKATGEHYLTDDLTAQALDFIDQQAKGDHQKPFFLYFCEFAVHGPLQAPPADVAYFDHKSTKGWNGQKNPIYAAMIKRLDISVGRIMKKLEATGLDDNTLIVFMSDNGGVSWNVRNPKDPTTSNAPLKGGKAMVYEGGIRVPLIFYGKHMEGGKWIERPVDCVDLFPTLLQLAGHTSPTPLDGQSLVPLLTNDDANQYTRNSFFWHYPLNVIVNNPDDGYPLTPHSAIRKGDYKLIFDWHGRLKLYNIEKDMSETNNLAYEMPKKTKELFGDLMTYLEHHVEKKYWPKPNPDYHPEKEARQVPFVDLYSAYQKGENVLKMAN